MRSIRQLFGKSSWYLSGYALAGLAGFISFPVWTRFLTISEYGVMNLVNSGLYFVVALSKCGLQKAATRFFAEFQSGKRSDSPSVYYTTLLTGVFAIGLIVMVGAIAGLRFIRTDWLGGSETVRIFEIAAVLGLFQTLNVILISFLTVEQKASRVAFWNVFHRYAAFGVGLLFAATIMKGVAGAIFGALVVEIIVVTCLTVSLIREKKLQLTAFSRRFFNECFSFGAPLSIAELCNVFLNVGDRYLIGIFLGTEAVGLYSAAYNLANSAMAILAMPLTFALPPMFMETWVKEGAVGTGKFLGVTMDLYLMVAVPCIAGLTFYGDRLMELMASSRYLEGAGLLPYLALPILLFGANTIYSAGLFIKKRSMGLMLISLVAAGVNVIANVVLIPTIGLTGAGVATLVAYLLTIGLMLGSTPAALRFRINTNTLFKYILAAGGMVLWLRLSTGQSPAGVIGTVLVGAIVYWALLLVIDKNIREIALELFRTTHTSLRLQFAKYTS